MELSGIGAYHEINLRTISTMMSFFTILRRHDEGMPSSP
jgi:hypothetical protein